ncbi:Metallocarboxypeptidase A-like protein like [Verticillium longisporum]|uniref:Metallocarboxypeptidase A-like protein like n=1 Tax=Verticillium longisporum TaxID=100787 RepID=A0A8I3ATH9_VERLO|nr:Metallocarboxypeptidase A-like protein like [Verticillium longisporum]
MRFIAAIPLVTLLVSANSIVSYEGYQALRVRFEGDLPAVQRKLSKLSYDEWERTADDITITLSPEQIPAFKSLGLKYDVMHGDLGASINAESASGAEWKRQIDDLAWYDSYHPYDDHKAYFEELHAAHPDHSEIISTGTSYEGRDIFGIHFWGDEGPGKPAIVFHGTVHAREWITAPVIEYLTLQLLTGYRNDNQTTVARDSYDFYIFPFVNPDGFVYTQTNDRLWRKNRQPPPNNSTVCWGRDINRNWPYKWDANPNGASADPCHFGYKGEAPGDTPEMAGLHAFIDRLRDTNGIKLFIDWHSYSQYLLAPLSWNCTQYIPKLGQHINLARRATQAIREVEGTQFVFGPSCATLYVATGYSIDYAYEVGKADWAYLIELRDTGKHGFVLPPAQIRGSAEEQWAGFKTILQYVDVEDIFEA